MTAIQDQRITNILLARQIGAFFSGPDGTALQDGFLNTDYVDVGLSSGLSIATGIIKPATPPNGNLIATMSSNSSAGQTAAASTAGNTAFGGAPWRAFNGSASTGWIGLSPSTDWLKISFSTAKTAGVYKVTNKPDGASSPTGFVLEGSNNNTTWNVLDTQSVLTWSAGETKTFSFTSSSYQHYRLTGFSSTGSDVCIAEWELHPPAVISAALVSASLGISEPYVYCAFLINNYTGVTFEIGGNAATVEAVYDFDNNGRKVVIVSGSGLMQYTVNMTNANTEIHGAAMWAE